jgi:hypothetical protein
VPATRPLARSFAVFTVVLLATAGGVALGGCKSSSSPTKPPPNPVQGRVELVRNDSYFYAHAKVSDQCDGSDTMVIDPAEDNFSPIAIAFDLSCSAEVQGEGQSANMELDGAVTYRHEGPNNSLSEIRLVAKAVGNRSATGLASSAAIARLRLQFEVTGDPVSYLASGSIEYADHFYDRFMLKPVGAPVGGETFLEWGEANGNAGSLSLSRSGTLAPGTYELHVELDTHDWFTEEVTFVVVFSAPTAT